jgi:hypothetical protein
LTAPHRLCGSRDEATVRVPHGPLYAAPLQICQLSKCRWQIELFFKWIRRHLRIKAFSGTSVDAENTQVWIAIFVYVLMAMMKKDLPLDRSLAAILQIPSITRFERLPMSQVVTAFPGQDSTDDPGNQSPAFDP